MASPECRLTSLDCPPTGEYHHKLGQCYCYLCTCGHHICPSVSRRYSPAVASLSSNYRMNFTAKQTKPVLQYIREGELLPSKGPMDFKTTGTETYKTHALTPSSKKLPGLRKRYAFPFKGNSSYRINYTDWKTCNPPIKLRHPAQTPSPVSFSGKTTYKHAFSGQPLPMQSRLFTRQSGSVNLGVRDFSMKMTTSNATYKPHAPEHFAVKVEHETIGLQPQEHPSNHFNTTYKTSFVEQSSPRRLLTYQESVRLASSLNN